MELNGKPFIPPTCPIDQYGDPIIISPDQFKFRAYDNDDFYLEPRHVTVLMGHFGELDGVIEGDDAGDNVQTDVSEVPQGSDEARQGHMIHGNEEMTRRMGALFCERVINCHGVVDGECWALGARALIEVVRKVGEV